MNPPKKGRPPKAPKGCQVRWTKAFGWRFRAVLRLAGTTLPPGSWRASKDEAAQDFLDMKKRAEQVADTPVLLNFEEGLRLFIERATERGFMPQVVKPCRPTTLKFYREISRTLFKRVGGDTLLQNVDATAITNYLNNRAAEEILRCKCAEKKKTCTHTPMRVGPDRLNKERLVWRLIFKAAIEANKHPGPNPVDRVDRRNDPPTEAQHYDLAQIAEMLAIIREHFDTCPSARRFHDTLALLFLAGLRGGELALGQPGYIDLRRGTFRVHEDGKTGTRTIPLRTPHIIVLRRMLGGLGKDDFILPGATHEQRAGNLKSNDFRRWKSKMPENLRDGFHAHTFRHSFETHLLESGVPEHHVRALMGHADRSITDRYAHATPQALRHSMAKAFDHVVETLLGATGEAATG